MNSTEDVVDVTIYYYLSYYLSWILLKSMTSLFSTVLLLYVPGEYEEVALSSDLVQE